MDSIPRKIIAEQVWYNGLIYPEFLILVWTFIPLFRSILGKDKSIGELFLLYLILWFITVYSIRWVVIRLI